MFLCEIKYQGGVSHHAGGVQTSLKSITPYGNRSDRITILRDMGATESPKDTSVPKYYGTRSRSSLRLLLPVVFHYLYHFPASVFPGKTRISEHSLYWSSIVVANLVSVLNLLSVAFLPRTSVGKLRRFTRTTLSESVRENFASQRVLRGLCWSLFEGSAGFCGGPRDFPRAFPVVTIVHQQSSSQIASDLASPDPNRQNSRRKLLISPISRKSA